ncbi:ribosome maturation factor RimM [Atopobacter sp. AH10]|uniref:ribosome maturation factor RimM n=1 Tax=Atopobacter sp. AH10 TaxID=2315861 RepID=UPI000EF27AE6|nr:ribosome maturation factor RimM [Atopobacter sp. AH10]RLK63278.1 ribosome maturation factor RimM [Atopobacter sp. AH10]
MNRLKLGTIVNTQGLKGEVRVKSVTDQPDQRYKVGQTVYVGNLPLVIRSYRQHKNLIIIAFQEYPTINEVEGFKGQDIFVDISDEQVDEDEGLYYHQIIGLSVETTSGDLVGKITAIESPGANDIWMVKGEKKSYAIPAIKEVIREIKLQEGKVIIEVMEGLLD